MYSIQEQLMITRDQCCITVEFMTLKKGINWDEARSGGKILCVFL